MKRFTKNDIGFKCINCGVMVPPLFMSSRDHCNICLHSRHVDINPGDRANECRGMLKPISITVDGKKGYVITYKCGTCQSIINNKAAEDDNFEEILRICKQQR